MKKTNYIQEQIIVNLAKSLLYEKALVKLDGQFVGARAAIARISQNVHSETDLNYGEIFIRDNVPVMIYLLIDR